MSPDAAWLALVDAHLARRPFMQVSDVYKLIYQGLRGPEHLITSPQDFARRLQGEFDSLPPAGDEALTESIRPDGRLHRLNLRPYKARRASLEALVEACLATARHSWGNPADLPALWETIVAAAQAGRWPSLRGDEVLAFSRWIAGQGFPAVHHSPAYRNACRPAYRLVAADALRQIEFGSLAKKAFRRRDAE